MEKGSILITGTNGGLGSAIVSQILRSTELATSLHGIYTVRRADTATNLSKVLQRASSQLHTHDVVALDLSRLSSVREAATDINHRVSKGIMPPIRAVVLNAAYMEWETHSFTTDGFDMSFQCNYLSQWLLTLLILQSMNKNGRIIIIGSSSHEYDDSSSSSCPIVFTN
jgi:NAD(P)-dependent dehydrogenase (short-subunit alcohol dehydrogenase family)